MVSFPIFFSVLMYDWHHQVRNKFKTQSQELLTNASAYVSYILS